MIAPWLLVVGLVGIGCVPGAGPAALVGALGVALAPLVRRYLGTRPWGLWVTPLVLGLGLVGGLDPRPAALPAAVAGVLAALLVYSRWSRTDAAGDRVTGLVAALAVVLAGATVDAPWGWGLVLALLPGLAMIGFTGGLRGRPLVVATRWGAAVGLLAAALGALTPAVFPGPPVAVSAPGLDEELDLAAYDALSQDPAVVATVRVAGGAPDDLYLRGGVWDTFDGRTWRFAGPPPRLRVAGAAPDGLRLRIVREPIDPPTVLVAGVNPTITPRTGAFVRSTDGTAVGATLAFGALAYELFASPPFGPDGRTVTDTTKERPSERLVPDSAALLAFVEGARSGAGDVVSRLNGALARDYSWTDRPGGRGVDDPVSAFFLRRTGTCAHFATALALGLRVEGLPTRVITGYAHGDRVDADTIVFRQRHAHAWVAFRRAEGWVEVDPTPAAPVAVATAAPASAASRRPSVAWWWGGLFALLAVPVGAGVAWARARRSPGRGVERAWAQAVAALEGRGIAVPDGPVLAAARGLAHQLGDEGAWLVALAAHRQAVVWGGEPEASHLSEAEALAARIVSGRVDTTPPLT